MEIYVSEHKSVGTLNPVETSVRVFVDRDFDYGYFVPEHQLFELLTAEQQVVYLQGESAQLDVAPAVAQQLIDIGQTPYAKRRVV